MVKGDSDYEQKTEFLKKEGDKTDKALWHMVARGFRPSGVLDAFGVKMLNSCLTPLFFIIHIFATIEVSNILDSVKEN